MTTGVHVNYGQVTKGSDSLSAHQRMEINTRYSHLSRSDLAGAGYVTTATAFLGATERSSGGDVLVATASVGAGSPGGSSPSAGSPVSGRSVASVGGTVAANTVPATLLINPMLQEHHLQFQQQMQQLRRQQQLQQELLIQQFQQQQQQLSEHYAKQMQASLEYLEQQKKLEEQKQERERHERERLESLKKKEKHEQSAVASSEVKQRLQEFVLNKKQREAAAAAANSANNSPPNFRNWSRQHQSLDQACPPSSASGSPGTSSSLTQSGISSRYRQVLLGKYDDDFPLRKTASEPNLKVRSVLKQKVIERRSSPLLRRKDRAGVPITNKRRTPLAMEGSSSGSSKPDSGPGSPPNGTNCPSSVHSSNGSTPIQEEPCTSPYQMGEAGSLSDLTLYSSPSMPNISLGRPPIHGGGAITVDGKGGGGVIHQPSEAQLRAIATVRLGMPLTSHILHPASVSYYPSLPEGEFTPPTSPSYVPQMKSLDQASRIGGSVGGQGPVMPGIYPTGTMLTDVQVAQARLHRYNSRSLRNIHRPLGRTQSAPLPLGHPMLNQSSSAAVAVAAQQGILLSAQQSEQYLREKQLYEQQQQQQHHLLKQHIRQTVLTRANSKNQVENVEEETEAAVAQEMKEALSPEATSAPPAQSSSPTATSSRNPEVIDLTELRGQADKRSASSAAIGGADSELDRQQKEREAFLQQQRDLMSRHTLQISEGSAFTPRHHHHHGARPLSRALSSPLVALNPTGSVSPQETSPAVRHTFTTGLVYDSLMLKHQCICGDNSYHPEHSGRLQSVWARLQETGLVSRCERVRSRKATLEEIQSCHSEAYTLLFGTNPLNRQKLDLTKLGELPIKNFTMLPCGGIGVDLDTTWNDLHTASAARMAAGCVTELAFKVATGEVKNGFAVVRPPGHHAEHQQAMGFCFFNSVAIAAKQLLQRLKLEKILIVDWDVHHGNGLQQMFYDNPRVLYISLHRHDDGNFFPGTGDPQEVGVDDGSGFNVNIAWSDSLNPPMGDSEYMAAFRCLVMPIAKDFDPDIVLVAAGFDSAAGHPPQLGGYTITPACFGYMTKQLMQLAKGKVVLALEGGYDLPAVCDCSQECVAVLLGDEGTPLKETEISRKPSTNAIESLQRIISIQAHHWPVIRRWAHTIQFSHLEAQQKENEEVETVTALASLSVAVHPTSAAHLQRSESQSLEDTPEEEPMEQDQEIK